MADTWQRLWEGWASGPGDTLLLVALTIAAAYWLALSGLAFAQARKSWRPGGRYALPAILVALAVAAAGIARPSSFHWAALAGLVLGGTVAAGTSVMLHRATGRCAKGHVVPTKWKFCPNCPSPIPAVAGPVVAAHVGRNVATVLRPTRTPVEEPPEWEPPPSVEAPIGGGVLAWLVPERSGVPDVAVVGPRTTVGRNPALEICIDDPSVSWEHAHIVTQDGCPAVIDAGSSNGTWVNGERVEHSLLLTDDRVAFGDSAFRVRRQ